MARIIRFLGCAGVMISGCGLWLKSGRGASVLLSRSWEVRFATVEVKRGFGDVRTAEKMGNQGEYK
jgi:hypothetical protein